MTTHTLIVLALISAIFGPVGSETYVAPIKAVPQEVAAEANPVAWDE